MKQSFYMWSDGTKFKNSPKISLSFRFSYKQDFSIETEDKSNELSHSSLLTFRNNLINKLHKTMIID